MDVTLRRALPSDETALKRAVYAAWRWREPWDEAAYQQHRLTAGADSYVDGFGTHAGDTGVVAMTGAGICGAAWFRYFTAESARAGYVADSVPELVLAIDEQVRGQGLGGRLQDQLLDITTEESVPRISLHVDAANARASSLYESRGFIFFRATPRGRVLLWGPTHEARKAPAAPRSDPCQRGPGTAAAPARRAAHRRPRGRSSEPYRRETLGRPVRTTRTNVRDPLTTAPKGVPQHDR